MDINISEIFASVQGEGRHLGHPSVFVRTSGCNLRCKWGDTLCDTPYTSWDPEHVTMSVEAVVHEVDRLREESGHIDHCVLTGGEPVLHNASAPLCDALSARGFFITVETNGTRFMPLTADFISISPKLNSSVPVGTSVAARHESLRINIPVIRQWLELYTCQLKFVVDRADDETEIVQILAELGDGVPTDTVYLMPQGISADQLHENSGTCLDICRRRGWRFTPRSHIELFGNERGT